MGSHLAHGNLEHLQEQQRALYAQPGPEHILLLVFLQEPLKHGIEVILEEEAGAMRGPAAGQGGDRLCCWCVALPRGKSEK